MIQATTPRVIYGPDGYMLLCDGISGEKASDQNAYLSVGVLCPIFLLLGGSSTLVTQITPPTGSH